MEIPFDVLKLVATYLVKPKMKLLDWIPIDWIYLNKIVWKELSKNPNAIHLMEQNPDMIDWKNLSRNPNAIPLLEANHEKINWDYLITNPNLFYQYLLLINLMRWDFLINISN